MKNRIINTVLNIMASSLDGSLLFKLQKALEIAIDREELEITSKTEPLNYLELFIQAKRIEGRSPKTLVYYQKTIENMQEEIKKNEINITTEDLRSYLARRQESNNLSKTTVDNIRRILSSYFSWLEDEEYILKSPLKRIHRVKPGQTVKEVIQDEDLERMRDACQEIRDLALIDFLASTGVRVGELVNLNIEDIDFYNRECKVLGKGDKERIVYFDAQTKIHLERYINERNDDEKALFISLRGKPTRLTITGIENRIKKIGEKAGVMKVHPHKFRRTLATNAIDKGMPIEQIQKLLGHKKIDTTLHYAMVKQSNVKEAHRRYIS